MYSKCTDCRINIFIVMYTDNKLIFVHEKSKLDYVSVCGITCLNFFVDEFSFGKILEHHYFL